MEIKLTPVENSTTVAAYGYNKKENIMRIEYHKTGLYDYSNITPFEFLSVQQAESKGSQVKIIINGKRFKRVV